ncbi:MAG: response regulator transcription factor [Bacteroidota bacterium]|nr:response regulator transcription factor [Bacteroidota bacterium]
MEAVKILIADDHELIHNGIRDMLRSIKKYKIIGKAMNGKEAIDMALELKPEIVFMDISMPVINGIEATKIIVDKLPGIKILALTQHEENEYVIQVLKSGGYGYLLKNSKKEEFVEAIETVLSGKKYVSKEISAQMINDLAHSAVQNQGQDKNDITLTKREKEIIQKIADDMSNQQIADELHISLRTVETHRRNIMQKLKVNTVVALLKYATQHNIISFD